jgi:hypothetical protein
MIISRFDNPEQDPEVRVFTDHGLKVNSWDTKTPLPMITNIASENSAGVPVRQHPINAVQLIKHDFLGYFDHVSVSEDNGVPFQGHVWDRPRP